MPKILSKIVSWRALVLTPFYVVSLLLTANTIDVLLNPCAYPTSNLGGKVKVRSVENHPPVSSSVSFEEAPINSKQTIDAILNSLSKAEIDWTTEVYLTENVTAGCDDFRFLSFEDVTNLRITFDGQPLNYYVSEEEGQKY
jgi:hypothetical protein